MCCLYILEVNSLPIASFANTFYHSEGCPFVLFLVSFAVQNLLSLTRSHLFLLLFQLLAGGWVIEDPAVIYVRDCVGYVFL